MIIARQSTARTVTVGPVLDADGVAVTDGVVADFKISKNGGAPAALNGSATLTHRNTGHYSLALTTSDLDTVGQAEIVIDDTVNACPMKELTVIEEAVYDALYAASATGALPVSSGGITSASFAAGAIDAAAIATGAIDADAIADNAIDAGAIAADAITAAKIANGAIDAATFAADVDAEILGYLVDDATRIDASALNTASTAVGSNGSGLTEAGGTGDHLTAVPWNAAWDAEVESEVTDSLIAHNLDHLCKTATAAADMTAEVADNTIIARILSNGDTSVFDPSTDGLQPIRDRGDAAWTTATGFSTHSAADVWAVATRILTAGTNINGSTFTSIPWNAAWDSEVQSEVQDAIEVNHLDHLLAADYDPASKPGVATALLNELVESDGGVSRYTANALEQAPTGGSAPTAAEIADAVWDESTTGHTTSGTFGEQTKTDIDAIKAKTDNLPAAPAATGDIPSAASIADAVWDEAQSGHTTAGTFGKYLDDEVSEVGGGSAPTAAEVADAVWDEVIAGHLTAGTTGAKLNSAAAASDPLSVEVPADYEEGTVGYRIGTYLTALVAQEAEDGGPVSTTDPYASTSDATDMRQWQQWRDLLYTGGTPLASEAAVEADTRLERWLLMASGWIEAAVLQGGKYTVSNLLTLSGASADFLKSLTVSLAYWIGNNFKKAGIAVEDVSGAKEALGCLEQLRLGQLVFGVQAAIDAHSPDVAERVSGDDQDLDMPSTEADRFFGDRQRRGR